MFLGDLSLDPILKRHRAFWQRDMVDRVCIAVTAPAARQVALPTAGSDAERLSDPEFVVRHAEARVQNTCYAGDALPVVYAEGNLLYRSKSLSLLAKRASSGEVPWLLDPSVPIDEGEAEQEIASWHGFGKYATRHLLVLMGFHGHLPVDREVGLHLGVRKSGDRGSNLDAGHFSGWGNFRFTAYKVSRVAKRENWIGD